MGFASLIVNKVHPKDLLALHVQVDGILTDVFSASFAVYDEADLDPAVLTGTVTTGNGHYATGSYGVYNAATSAFWTPIAVVAKGYVEWTYVLVEDDDPVTIVRRFEVVAATVARAPEALLALVQDCKDAGVTGTDAEIHASLVLYRDIFERYARQHFRLVRERRRFVGTNTDTFFLPEPLYGLAEAKTNNVTDAIDLAQLAVYGATGSERRNPKIAWYLPPNVSVYAASDYGVFSPGVPQFFTGLWGYVEAETLGPPEPIQMAMIRAVRLATDEAATGTLVPVAGGPVIGEVTDGHEIRYGFSTGKTRGGLVSILRDPMVKDALDLYLAPIALGTSSSRYPSPTRERLAW